MKPAQIDAGRVYAGTHGRGMDRALDFLDREALPERQERQEPRELAVERHLLHHFPAQRAHAAGHVVEPAAGDATHEQVKDPVLQAVDERVAPGPAPRDGEIGAGFHPRQQTRYRGGLGLKVRRQRDQQRAAGSGRGELDQRGLAHALHDLHQPDRLALRGQLAERIGQVAEPGMADEDELERPPRLAERRGELPIQRGERGRPLDHRNDDGDVQAALAHVRSTAMRQQLRLRLTGASKRDLADETEHEQIGREQEPEQRRRGKDVRVGRDRLESLQRHRGPAEKAQREREGRGGADRRAPAAAPETRRSW